MDMKIYEKTRYQNIYRHKKNKNYLIMISKPIKTSISRIDKKKILSIEEAVKIRDNPKIKLQKANESIYRDEFDNVWDKYINTCVKVKKLAFKTVEKKKQFYNIYLKDKFKRLSKITKEDVTNFLYYLNTTDKQKNEILKILKAFFNWCVEEEILIISPAQNINKFKVQKPLMKYWIPVELKRFLETLDHDINSNDIDLIYKAKRIKIFTLLGFCLGDRVGETRALTFDCFDNVLGIVRIKHSINYDRSDKDFLSQTKNYHSQREVDITNRVIEEINNYKEFLKKYLCRDVKDTDIIFFNYSSKRPYSDTTLRKDFYYYCNKAKVTKIRPYDLRHTYVATMMGEGKELYLISERLGHKNYSTTVNKYGHLSSKTKKEVAKITDKYI